MSYEVVCAECEKTILIEDLGVEVHCPHCDTILMLTEEDAEEVTPPPAVEPTPIAATASEIPAEEFPSFDFTSPPAAKSEPAPVPDVSAPASPAVTPAPAAGEAPNFDFLGSPAADSEEAPAFSFGAPTETAPALTTEPVKTASADEPISPIKAEPSFSRRNSEVSRTVMLSLISYSIFVTLSLLYLLIQYRTAKPHQLESLPDIKPAERGKMSFYRENATLAPGHTLAIGESQRFGNVRITPIRVTRGSLRFQHFQGLPNTSKPPTEPVYKLWLKVENVSDDQVFAPLDVELLSLRSVDTENLSWMRANNWVCSSGDFDAREKRVLMFDHSATSEYDIAGMVGRPLKPGETVETFLPTEEHGLQQLRGELIWRFQLRKGLNPESKNGVTTLVEVRFDSDEIRSES